MCPLFGGSTVILLCMCEVLYLLCQIDEMRDELVEMQLKLQTELHRRNAGLQESGSSQGESETSGGYWSVGVLF